MNISAEDGKSLLKIARDSISLCFSGKEQAIPSEAKKKFSEYAGAFVTITIDGELRGCIGFTEPVFMLWEAVSSAARAAAFEDPRFPELNEEELANAKIEVSVLSRPELIEEPYESKIKIGKHGLIAEKGEYIGLLLPQVFTEYSADAKKALEMTCEKAGLNPNAWKESSCRIYRFSAQIFSEK